MVIYCHFNNWKFRNFNCEKCIHNGVGNWMKDGLQFDRTKQQLTIIFFQFCKKRSACLKNKNQNSDLTYVTAFQQNHSRLSTATTSTVSIKRHGQYGTKQF